MSNTPPLRVLNRTSGQYQRPKQNWERGARQTAMMGFQTRRQRNDWISRARAAAHAQRVNAARLMRLFGREDDA